MGKKNSGVNTPHTNSGNAPHGRTYSVVPHTPGSGSSGTGTSSSSGTSGSSDATSGLAPEVAQALEDAANVIRKG
ncbi:hypothetical protein GCM10010402_16520 [Actinomadura luteofluorescens]|uniref:hypothetical protein n=1 Tax=Actinomadura luteofluorescens TaxID=46163 RepID=UPI002164AF88|nr:hypothetical protein [Actinomadura glauciflava]MCR3739933.1 hypothetical protein [Actinomadura glauciflava]